MKEAQARFFALCEELKWKNEAEVSKRRADADKSGDTEDEQDSFSQQHKKEEEEEEEEDGRLILPEDFFLPAEHDLSEARLTRFKEKVSEGEQQLVRRPASPRFRGRAEKS